VSNGVRHDDNGSPRRLDEPAGVGGRLVLVVEGDEPEADLGGWTDVRPKRDIMRDAHAADGRRYSVAVRGRYRIVDAECLNVRRAEQEEAR
jgi:hypothetical protein